MDTAPPNPAEEQPARFITKSNLADLLGVSVRTVSTYISAGYLPAPHRLGRDAAWPVPLLKEHLSESAEPQLPGDIRSRLQDSLDRADAEGTTVGSGESRRARLAGGLLMDEEANVAADWRPQLHARNAELRKSAREHEAEAKDYHWSSDERRQLQKFSADLREEVDRNEAMLKGQFLPAHSTAQVLTSMYFVANSVFLVRAANEPREPHRSVTFLLPGSEIPMTYEGPELRQDDGLVFSVLVRVAADVRPGRLVGFSARELCTELYGGDSGPRRVQLRAAIERLQSGKVRLPGLTVQLVGRFEYPKRGIWAVALDPDVLRLFSGGMHVWLKLDAALFYGAGLTGWLYRYISGQTTLIPTKVTRLHRMCGSSARPKSFHEMLRRSLRALQAGGEIDDGWHIDKADMVRWRKPVRPDNGRLSQVA